MKDLWMLLYGNTVTKYSPTHLLSLICACNFCGCLLRLHMLTEIEKCLLVGSWEAVLPHFPLEAGLLSALAQDPHGFVWGLETCKDGEPRASLAPVPVLPSPPCYSLFLNAHLQHPYRLYGITFPLLSHKWRCLNGVTSEWRYFMGLPWAS